MTRSLFRLSAVPLLLVAAAAFAHETWLVRTHYSPSGDTAYLEIGHGHEFPVSEEAPNANQMKAWLTTADGSKSPVSIAKEGNALKLEAKLPSRQMARVYYERDRGVISQTASGWKAGGRKEHPQAKTSMRSAQFGVAWVGFTGTSNNAKPLGLALELNYEEGIRGRLVRVWRDGKPARNVEVFAVVGEENLVTLGKTNRDGYVSAAKAPERGPVLFRANVDEAAPKGADYDKTVLSCTLTLPAE